MDARTKNLVVIHAGLIPRRDSSTWCTLCIEVSSIHHLQKGGVCKGFMLEWFWPLAINICPKVAYVDPPHSLENRYVSIYA